jgi:hypothetical protein
MGTSIVEAVSSAFGLIPDIFSTISAIFWTTGEGGTGGEFTFIGYLALFAVGLALTWVGFRVIRGFMHMRG